MTRNSLPPRPTDSELAILKVLWQLGPQTVREVMETLQQERPTGYTTVLKLLQIMTEKGLVTRDESKRTHVYKAAFSENDTQKRLVGDLIDRAFDQSAQKLVMHALNSKRVSRQELAEIRHLLDRMEGDEQ